MKMLNKKNNRQAGFTLVELSIVLVIIGLIISSVLVGQDLVRSAELRSTITQLEGFNAAVGTFKGKYNGLPGDVAGATNFGFIGNGDGDNKLIAAGTATALDGSVSTSENTFFWNHLGSSSAALISGSYTGNVAVTSSNIAANLPSAKAGNYWGVFAGHGTVTAEVASSTAEAGTNYYILGVTGSSTSGQYTTAATLTPLEALNIDSKLDDGKPSTGTVRARRAQADAPDTAPSSATTATACVTYTGAAYTTEVSTNTYTTSLKTAACTLRFKMPL